MHSAIGGANKHSRIFDQFRINKIDSGSENVTASSDCQIFQFDILELEITMFD